MARQYSETTSMADMPKLVPNGGFPSKGAVEGKNKPQPGSGLEQIDGSGTQTGSHPAKTQSKTMRYF